MKPDRWAWSPIPAPCQAWGPVGLTATHLEPPQELKLKDEECERLSKVREQLERELEELTASLFEVPWPAGRGAGWGMGLLEVRRLLAAHAGAAFLPGSPQDGAGSQHETGSVGKAAERGAGQGEARPAPRRGHLTEPWRTG